MVTLKFRAESEVSTAVLVRSSIFSDLDDKLPEMAHLVDPEPVEDVGPLLVQDLERLRDVEVFQHRAVVVGRG